MIPIIPSVWIIIGLSQHLSEPPSGFQWLVSQKIRVSWISTFPVPMLRLQARTCRQTRSQSLSFKGRRHCFVIVFKCPDILIFIDRWDLIEVIYVLRDIDPCSSCSHSPFKCHSRSARLSLQWLSYRISLSSLSTNFSFLHNTLLMLKLFAIFQEDRRHDANNCFLCVLTGDLLLEIGDSPHLGTIDAGAQQPFHGFGFNIWKLWCYMRLISFPIWASPRLIK